MLFLGRIPVGKNPNLVFRKFQVTDQNLFDLGDIVEGASQGADLGIFVDPHQQRILLSKHCGTYEDHAQQELQKMGQQAASAEVRIKITYSQKVCSHCFSGLPKRDLKVARSYRFTLFTVYALHLRGKVWSNTWRTWSLRHLLLNIVGNLLTQSWAAYFIENKGDIWLATAPVQKR